MREAAVKSLSYADYREHVHIIARIINNISHGLLHFYEISGS